jgi:hypothetical protein
MRWRLFVIISTIRASQWRPRQSRDNVVVGRSRRTRKTSFFVFFGFVHLFDDGEEDSMFS